MKVRVKEMPVRYSGKRYVENETLTIKKEAYDEKLFEILEDDSKKDGEDDSKKDGEDGEQAPSYSFLTKSAKIKQIQSDVKAYLSYSFLTKSAKIKPHVACL